MTYTKRNSHLIDRGTVAVVKGSDPFEATSRALKMIQKDIDIRMDEKVLIKPNCVRPVAPDEGVTTDSRVVEAIIECIKRMSVKDITIAEGGNPGTDKAFKVTGLIDLAERHGIRLVNINNDDWEMIPIPGGKALEKVRIAKTVLESDCIINVPKLKIHHMAQVTLSLKNLMGVIIGDRGRVMHRRLDEKIVDLASLFRPRLNVVDGVVGAEMDEVVGKPVQMNVILAGVDMVSVDAVGSAVMGLDPSAVRHIQMAVERGLGIGDLNYINVIGEPIKTVARKFSQKYSDRKLETYNLKRPLSAEDIAFMKSKFENRE